jgi:benzoyl-CoA reductase subunit D
MFYTVGIDVGNSSIKAALVSFDGKSSNGLSEGKLINTHVEKIRKRSPVEIIKETYTAVLRPLKLSPNDVAYVASTGEGEMVDFRKGHFYSMTAHARGGIFLAPQAKATLDIGALHAKAIAMDSRSRVLEYRMTSQCASGSGQFLENIARYLGVAQEDIGSLSIKAQQPETVSGICAVLAETDVINMVSRGISTGDILKGIHLSMARRLLNLLRILKLEGDVIATGGLATDTGMIAALQELANKDRLNLNFISHQNSILAGAIGAALWAGVRQVKLQEATL